MTASDEVMRVRGEGSFRLVGRFFFDEGLEMPVGQSGHWLAAGVGALGVGRACREWTSGRKVSYFHRGVRTTYLGSGMLVPETGRAQMDGGGWSRPVPALVGCRLPGFPSV